MVTRGAGTWAELWRWWWWCYPWLWENAKKSDERRGKADPPIETHPVSAGGVARAQRGGTLNPYVSKPFCIFVRKK